MSSPEPAEPASPGDHLCAGLAVAAATGWAATAVTDSILLGLVTIASLGTLSGVAAYTAVVRPGMHVAGRVAGTAAAVAAAAVFLVAVESPWAWAVPPVALAAGLAEPRSRRARLVALAVTAATAVAAGIAEFA